jgi:hypothetical protein
MVLMNSHWDYSFFFKLHFLIENIFFLLNLFYYQRVSISNLFETSKCIGTTLIQSFHCRLVVINLCWKICENWISFISKNHKSTPKLLLNKVKTLTTSINSLLVLILYCVLKYLFQSLIITTLYILSILIHQSYPISFKFHLPKS